MRPFGKSLFISSLSVLSIVILSTPARADLSDWFAKLKKYFQKNKNSNPTQPGTDAAGRSDDAEESRRLVEDERTSLQNKNCSYAGAIEFTNITATFYTDPRGCRCGGYYRWSSEARSGLKGLRQIGKPVLAVPMTIPMDYSFDKIVDAKATEAGILKCPPPAGEPVALDKGTDDESAQPHKAPSEIPTGNSKLPVPDRTGLRHI